jgi:hypothetical protein
MFYLVLKGATQSAIRSPAPPTPGVGFSISAVFITDGDPFPEVITCVTSKERLRRLPSRWHSGSLDGDSRLQRRAQSLNRDSDLRWPGGARFALAGLASIIGGVIGR